MTIFKAPFSVEAFASNSGSTLIALGIAIAALTAVPCATQAQSNCVAPAAGLVSWWKSEGNTADAAGSNNGTLIGNTTYGAGRVGQSFVLDGGGDGVSVGNSANLQLQNFTIEAWIKRSNLSLASLGGEGAGVIFGGGNGAYALALWDNGQLTLAKVGDSGVQSTQRVTDVTSFHHVAVTKNGSTVLFYLDGVGETAAGFNPGFVFAAGFVVGARGGDYGASFLGYLDEVSFYNRALSAAEIQSIYNAGDAGKCTSNPPVILTQPTDQTVPVGGIATFSVTAGGTPPLSYQWLFNGTNIAGATASSLVLSSVQSTQSGNYNVQITNSSSSIVSSNAILTVTPAPACVTPPTGLVSWWRAEGNALDTAGTNNGTLVGNTTYGAGRVGQALVLDGSGDGISVGNPTNLQLQDFTIEAWIKRSSPVLASLGGQGAGVVFGGGNGAYTLALWDDGQLTLGKIGESGVQSSLAITDTTGFHHVAVTKSGSTVVFFVDGVGETAAAYNPGFVFASGFAVGARAGDFGASFLGSLDEVSFYNRALSAGEIQSIYNSAGTGKCTGSPPPNCVPPPSALVSWWRGESNAFDQIGFNDGTLGGNANYGPGKVGQGFLFGGQGDYVSAGSSDSLRFTNNFSITAWIFPTGPGQNPAEGGTIVDREGEYALARFADGTIRWAYANQSPGWLWTSSGGVAPLNQWTHVAVTYSSGVSSTFINGQLVQSFAGSGLIGDAYPSLNELRIGGRQAVDSGFAGKIDEVAIFGHAMTSNEVAAIFAAGSDGMCPTSTLPFIMTQPASQTVTAGDDVAFIVAAGGTQPLRYQWRLNGTNVAGATTTSLLLSSVQLAQAGNYSVLITNTAGPTLSSNALLTVNPQPPCAVPPAGLVSWWKGESNALDQVGGNNGTLGGNAAFGPGRAGRGFVFDGQGSYVSAGASDSLRFSNNVTIAAWIFPTGPGQNPAEGGTIVNREGEYTLARFADGSIQWGFANQSPGWLWTPSGGFAPLNQWTHVALTYSNGLASTFINGQLVQAYAGNGLIGDAYPSLNELRIGGRQAVNSGFAGSIDEVAVFARAVSSNEVAAIYAAGNAGMCPPASTSNCVAAPSGLVSWWKADGNTLDTAGSNNGTLVGNTSYGAGLVGPAYVLDGSGDGVSVGNPANLQLQNFTIEAWIKRSSASLASHGGEGAGVIYGGGNGAYVLGLWDDGQLTLGKIGESGVASSQRVTDITNFHHVAVTKNGSTVVFYLDGVAETGSAYDPGFVFSGGGFVIGARGGDYGASFLGSLDEVSFYNRALTGSEIQSIYTAAGNGKCSSASAPFIISQPNNQAVTVGSNASFSVVAGGSPPPSYQWLFNGTNIAGATGTSYTVANAQFSDAGPYSVLVSNTVNSVLSSNANLTVNPVPSALRVGDVSTPSGTSVTVPVLLTANGFENSLGLSLNFSTSRLTYVGAVLAVGSGATLVVNDSGSSTGRIGMLIGLSGSGTFPPGTQELAEVTFTSAIVTNPVATTVSFVDSPIPRQVSGIHGNVLPATYASGTVSIAAADFEADVTPPPGGDKSVTASDWSLIGRYAAHLESPTNAIQFQRADCAPRGTLGDGHISITDWVQAGRYAARLDPSTIAGGPTAPTGPLVLATPIGQGQGPRPLTTRQVMATNTTLNQGQSATISVKLQAQGNENAIGFSLYFDPASLIYTGVSLGSAASGALYNVNTDGISSGKLGLTLAVASGTNLPPGLDELFKVTFKGTLSATGNVSVTFTDDPIFREISDPAANVLPADYNGGTLTINPLPSLRISRGGQGINLAWEGWATNYVLQEADAQTLPSLNWTNPPASGGIVNGQNVFTLPLGSGTKFYRLLQQ